MVVIYEKLAGGLVEMDRIEDVGLASDGMYQYLNEKFGTVDEARELFVEGYFVEGNRHYVIRHGEYDYVAELVH